MNKKKYRNYGNIPATTYHIDFNFLNLKPQNDGPDETQDETGVAIDNVLSTNGLQTDLKREKETIVCIIPILHTISSAFLSISIR